MITCNKRNGRYLLKIIETQKFFKTIWEADNEYICISYILKKINLKKKKKKKILKILLESKTRFKFPIHSFIYISKNLKLI